jgi:hypothetical protein
MTTEIKSLMPPVAVAAGVAVRWLIRSWLLIVVAFPSR